MIFQVQGVILHSAIVYRPRRTLLCCLKDESGELYLRFLNFYPSQVKALAKDKQIRAIGEVRRGSFGLEMVHPRYSSADENTPLNTSLTPIYPTTAGLSQTQIRKLVAHALEALPLMDTLPSDILQSLQFPGFAESIRLLHNPSRDIYADTLLQRTHSAWRRVKFDELLSQQLAMRMQTIARNNLSAPVLEQKFLLIEQLIKNLPFTLTRAQQQAFTEISRDLSRSRPMQRLLLGDVGSGKTIVAAFSALQTVENGYQTAILSPTEVLAEQNFFKMRNWLEPLGINIVWLSGSMKKKEKQHATHLISTGFAQVAIGTHALFQQNVFFKNLGLAIIDEQHKFGVEQRLALRKKGSEPHQLMMSATPIPRSLAMSYYADFELSEIYELPPGRTPVITKLVNSSRRNEILEKVHATYKEGFQTYWVCPLIDESESLQLQTVIDTHKFFSELFSDIKIGILHGRLDSTEKAQIMNAFKSGEVQLLIATTVIEVGVDVPGATLMVIEHAERLGLAQLHQLRGRVGRGASQSTCVLLYQQPLSELARSRLKIIFENNDGFVIAREDLKLRGPGELLGARQSGIALLRFADICQDGDLLNQARLTADNLLRNYPEAVQSHLARWMRSKHQYLYV